MYRNLIPFFRVLGTPSNPLWNGLLAYYTADSTSNDALGTYNGTLVNGATYGTGVINQGFSLNGVNQYVNLGNVFDNDGTQNLSISAWIYRDTTSTQSIFSRFPSAGDLKGYDLHVVGNKIRFYIGQLFPTNCIIVEASTVLSTSTFYNVVVTYDGSKSVSGVKIYINGTLQTLSTIYDVFTGSSSAVTASTTIGSRAGGSLFFNGIVDEIAPFNDILTQSEVTELYNSGSGLQYS